MDHVASIKGLIGVPSWLEKSCSIFFLALPLQDFASQEVYKLDPPPTRDRIADMTGEQLDQAVTEADGAGDGPFFAGIKMTQANVFFPGQTYHSFKIVKVGRASRQECVGNRRVDSVPLTALAAVKNLALLRSCPLPMIVSASIYLKLGTVCPQLKVQGGPGNILGCC